MTRSNGWKAHFDQHLVEGLRIWLFTSTFSRVTQTFSSEDADMWTYKYFLAVWCWRESRGGMIKEIIDSLLQPRAWCCGLGVVVLNICFGWEPQRWEDEIQPVLIQMGSKAQGRLWCDQSNWIHLPMDWLLTFHFIGERNSIFSLIKRMESTWV